MAIDASIPLRALLQTAPPPEGPLDTYGKSLSLQNLMQQNKLGGLQVQEAQQSANDEKAARNLFAANPSISDEQLLQQLGGSRLAQTLVTARAKARADAEAHRKNKLENDVTESNLVGSQANTVKAAGYDPAAFSDMLDSLKSHGIDMPYDQFRAAAAQDPANIQRFTDAFISKSDKQRELGQKDAEVKNSTDKNTREQKESDLKQSDFDQKQAQERAGVLIPGSEFTDKTQNKAAMFRVLQPDGSYKTEMRVIGAQGAPPKAEEPGKDIPYSPAVQQQKIDIAGATAAARKAATTGPAVDIQPGDKNFKIAQDLAYGKLTFSDFRSLYGRAASTAELKTSIYEKAGELNPNFNPAGFEMGLKLASNPKVQQQLSAMDNVQQAVPDLLKLSDDATRTGITKINDLIIKGGIALGSKKYSNLAAARTAFADELSGALGFGGATDMSRQMGFDMTRTDLSPEAFASGIKTIVVPFLERKRDSLLKQMGVYGKSGMNPAAPETAKPITDVLIQRNMQANPKATRQQIIDALTAAGYEAGK